ncbi:TetR/AcrR family transcriptional regulator [Enteractinococcus fodinae]|uniref:AcrR family transcriptional regulator n=1 Tax=Enteractinococcus fodinae TaxID=684663 RepID=A0ABU2B4T0_9MICC|nr:TetR/AcrR family transcriptional regulator [Enteractinococcus fodinae]MDR7348401.1 AcrR family transcriptional regulator [Enteractinococcus fodinae]
MTSSEKKFTSPNASGATGPQALADVSSPDTTEIFDLDSETQTGQIRGRIARDQILTAAIECLLANGYAATTTMKVQEHAGVSRGKLLHHFPSKRELITAAIRRLAADRLTTSSADYSNAPPTTHVKERVAWSVNALWTSFFHPNFWAATETWIAARTDPELAAELLKHERAVLRRVRENAHRLFGEHINANPQFSRMLDVIFTSMRGMALTYTFSGRNPETEPMIATWTSTALTLLGEDEE